MSEPLDEEVEAFLREPGNAWLRPFLPGFIRVLHHLPAALKEVDGWRLAQLASGVVGRAVFWHPETAGPANSIGAELADRDAVFLCYLKAASPADTGSVLPGKAKDVFRTVCAGVLVEAPGQAPRIVSGVVSAVVPASVSFNGDLRHAYDYEKENAKYEFDDGLRAFLADPQAREFPSLPTNLRLGGAKDWGLWRAVALLKSTVAGARAATVRYPDAEDCSACFAVPLKPPLSLQSADGQRWVANVEDAEFGGARGRGVVFEPFLLDASRRWFFGRHGASLGPPGAKSAFQALLRQWHRGGEGLEGLRKAISRAERKRSGGRGLQFTVPEWFPRGVVTLLAADGSTGKTTMLHHLVTIVGTPPELRPPGTTWLGIPVAKIAHGAAVMFTAEEPDEWIEERDDVFDPDGLSLRGQCWDGTGLSIDAVIEHLDGHPDLALVVIDPARKFLAGNESDSDDVDAFLTRLQDLARKKNCAVVVVHHLGKGGGGARGLSGQFGVVNYIRGSQVWIDRPRCVIAMQRKGSDADGWVVSLKVVKSNVPPTCAMATDVRSFNMDRQTRTLTPVGTARGKSSGVAAAEGSVGHTAGELDAVCGGVALIVGGGGVVTRTGKRELFERRIPALAGMSRAKLRRVVNVGIARGRLKLTDANYIEPSSLQ